ncbi:MAG: hypothetical protein LUG87_00980, partial [Oscillospiraceae bacterium]|nr:hypothetical protein [Oscillospiraceae bacterium]
MARDNAQKARATPAINPVRLVFLTVYTVYELRAGNGGAAAQSSEPMIFLTYCVSLVKSLASTTPSPLK